MTEITKKSHPAPTISACMIVKNEEQTLSRCLASIAGFVDEIIIVDTGSEDGTIEIAKSFGARVYHHPWEHNFSLHRNQSLRYAVCDWILIIDADEEFFCEDTWHVKPTLTETEASFLFLQCYDLDQSGMQKGFLNQVRIFKNHLGMHYTHSVHNQLQTTGTQAYSRLRFRHYGYDLSPELMQAKHVRTTTLLKKSLADNPHDGYCLYQLAASHSMNKDYIKVVEYGQKSLDIMRQNDTKPTYYLNNFYLVAAALYALKELQSAERFCHEATETFGLSLDICHILSTVLFKQKRLDLCMRQSQRFLQMYVELQEDPSKVGNGSCYCFNCAKRSEVFTGLACAHYMQKDYSTADRYFRKAFEDSGQSMHTAEGIYLFYIKQQRHTDALYWLARAYECGCTQNLVPTVLQNNPGLYLSLSHNYLQQEELKAAQSCLQRAPANQLSEIDQHFQHLLQIRIYWHQNAIQNLINELEVWLPLLGFETNRCLDSLDDLGLLIYDLAEALVQKRFWPLAEPTLKLAAQIAPTCFKLERFQSLLAGATP